MKKINISCFLNSEEEAEVQEYIKNLLKDPDAEFESGGLGVRVERAGDWGIFDVYRIIGTAEVKIQRKKSRSKVKKSKGVV